ncbi:hypothetical protein [Streptomyces prasinus]|uniref:hypothetical protein n=1 Tax=Streptomyces prasinus TaxID=67345 RepID=UPI003404ECDA
MSAAEPYDVDAQSGRLGDLLGVPGAVVRYLRMAVRSRERQPKNARFQVSRRACALVSRPASWRRLR